MLALMAPAGTLTFEVVGMPTGFSGRALMKVVAVGCTAVMLTTTPSTSALSGTMSVMIGATTVSAPRMAISWTPCGPSVPGRLSNTRPGPTGMIRPPRSSADSTSSAPR